MHLSTGANFSFSSGVEVYAAGEGYLLPIGGWIYRGAVLLPEKKSGIGSLCEKCTIWGAFDRYMCVTNGFFHLKTSSITPILFLYLLIIYRYQNCV